MMKLHLLGIVYVLPHADIENSHGYIREVVLRRDFHLLMYCVVSNLFLYN